MNWSGTLGTGRGPRRFLTKAGPLEMRPLETEVPRDRAKTFRVTPYCLAARVFMPECLGVAIAAVMTSHDAARCSPLTCRVSNTAARTH